jgi:hypothetical protein
MGQVVTAMRQVLTPDFWLTALPGTDIGLPGFLSTTGSSPLFDMIFHIVILVSVFIFLMVTWSTLNVNIYPPSTMPLITATQRIAFPDLTNNPTALMLNYKVATANYGGIFTEQRSSNYIGTVSPDAVHSQITAGARAILFDVWPNPSDLSNPIVAAMEDNNSTMALRWWKDNGLGGPNSGMGDFSNWKIITRNSVDLQTMLSTIPAAAFNNAENPGQNGDPFFVILNLHGAMSVPYLNTVGKIMKKSFAGRQMPVEYSKSGGTTILATAPISAFGGLIFVIANIVVDQGFQALPGLSKLQDVNDKAFDPVSGAIDFAEAVNLISGGLTSNAGPKVPSVYTPANAAAIESTKVGTVPLTKSIFCAVQPSIGTSATDNDTLFKDVSFQSCYATGAHFVGVNLFDKGDSSDPSTVQSNQATSGTLSSYFALFPETSFK